MKSMVILPPGKTKPDLMIVGAGNQAEHVTYYLRDEGKVNIIGYAVEPEYRNADTFNGLPVFDLDDAVASMPYLAFYVAVTFAELNRVRWRLMDKCSRRWTPYTFIHRSCVIASPLDTYHTFINPLNNIDPGVTMGDNVYLHAHNHIGHHSEIGNNVFIASGVTVSGNCKIGDNSFVGVNACIAHGVTVGANCILGAGVYVNRDVPDNSVVKRSGDRPVEGRDAREVKL